MSILNMVIGKVANDGIKNGLTPIQCVLLKCCHALVSCFSKTVKTNLENGRFFESEEISEAFTGLE